MNDYNHLAQNLKKYKTLKGMTMNELSDELDIPKTTLQNVMNEGNATLYTAIRISRGMGIGLDMLVSDETFSDKLFIMEQMQRAGSWLAGLPDEKRDDIAQLISKMWAIMGEQR